MELLYSVLYLWLHTLYYTVNFGGASKLLQKQKGFYHNFVVTTKINTYYSVYYKKLLWWVIFFVCTCMVYMHVCTYTCASIATRHHHSYYGHHGYWLLWQPITIVYSSTTVLIHVPLKQLVITLVIGYHGNLSSWLHSHSYVQLS